MTDLFERRPVGHSSVSIARIGLGCGTLGDPDELIPEEQAAATLAAAYEGGIRHFDTAPWYGNTKSEHRVGRFLRTRPRESFTVSTKVGRIYFRPEDPNTFAASPWMKRWKGGLPFDLRFDYTRDGVLRSYEDSLQRLGLNTVDALVIHDLDLKHRKSEEGVARGFGQLESGGMAALEELKARGEIRAIGAGVNHIGMIPRFLERFDLDFFLVAMPYTLLDQEALDEEFPMCLERGVSVIVGAVFASGILARGPHAGVQYAYQPAGDDVLTRVRRMDEICRRHGTSLAAAALQFPLAHPAVAAIIPGANSPEQVRANLKSAQTPVPSELWSDMRTKGLIRADAPVPGEAADV